MSRQETLLGMQSVVHVEHSDVLQRIRGNDTIEGNAADFGLYRVTGDTGKYLDQAVPLSSAGIKESVREYMCIVTSRRCVSTRIDSGH